MTIILDSKFDVHNLDSITKSYDEFYRRVYKPGIDHNITEVEAMYQNILSIHIALTLNKILNELKKDN